ncbi:CUB domain family protein [Brugia pahangi]
MYEWLVMIIADIIKRLELSNSKKKDGSGRKFRNLLTALKSHIALLDNRLKKDECSDNPCKNGATCIDLYNKFMCICPSHFEGETCENRIDECSIYQGTPAGCQNNASCILNPDGFHCVCQQGFHGALCQLRATACEFSLDLCGPAGHCIPTQPDPETNEPGYRCLCEWGYRSSADRNNPVCEDVNECESNPCYPGTTCINLPGSFKCAGCPPGMTGNGMICLDVDECASEDLETCSKDPPVKCINTIGSYECASCPPGYKGNGHICKKQSPCELSPCHPKAKCYNMGMSSLNEEGFRCECPLGMIGDGIGTEGCYHSNVTLCRADTCYNQGTCQIISEEAYKCHCKWGYVGKRCELATACLSNICRSRGECLVKKDGSFECVCLKGYYGPTCEYEEDGCGGHIINETGVIKYPDWTWYHFGRNKTCEWIIIVNELNKVIEINFTSFHLPTRSATCATADANVTLRDGEHANSPLVGVFCGPRGSTTVPVSRPIYFSSNKAYIAFVSGKSTTGIGNFALHWRTVEKKCGERIYSDDGQISLYGYKRSEICQWHVSVDPKMHIEITVEPMKLASGDVRNCSVNSLELFDGLEIDETERILHLCSSETTRTLVRTTLPYFTAYFRSNYPADFPEEHCDGDSLCSRGFTIHYRTIKLDKDCGGTILPDADDAFEGYIQSPNYGFNYFPNLDCLWLLDASAVANVYDAKVIKVEIVDLDIPSAPARSIKETSHFRLSFSESTAPNQRLVNLIRPCRFDHITFRNGEDTSHPILGRYCNGRRPEGPIVSSGPKMVIQFHSNQSINGKGFKIHYSAACEKHFTSSNGTIQSSNYPNGSTQPFKCTYVIDAEKTKAIRLKFNFIGLNTDIKTCFYDVTKHNLLEDYVEFSGGHDSHDQINKRYVCARYPFVAPDGEMVTSASRSLKITLSSSGISNKGILFLYEQFDVGCGGIFEGESGQITSPNYPEKYLAHMYCIYVISTPNKRIRLTFEVFELEVVPSREDCSFDSIEIYDTYVNDDDHSELHGRYCGTLLPPPILSTGNRLTIVFKSDRSVNGAGFMAKWQIVDDKIDCHRTYTATSGRIIIHAETEMKFVQCDYQIALQSSKRILLRFENLSAPCDEGTLMLRNGVNEQSPGFGGLFRDSEICDDHPVRELRSQGNRVFMRLTTRNAPSVMFTIYYQQIDSDCGGRLVGFSGALSAPQYPLKDSRTLNCDWHIHVAAGNRVRFTITVLDDLNSADSNGFCSSFAPNYIDVAEGSSASARILRRYCKKEISLSSVDSEKNELTIRYRQHGGTHFGSLFGFLAHYTTVCNQILLFGQHGILQSPGYPEQTLENRFCKWRIQTTKGNRIRLMFHFFRITESNARFTSTCLINYLEFGENQILESSVTIGGQQNHTKTTRKFCDRIGKPVWILTENEVVDITFSSKTEPENHFWLSWSNEGCGGDITSPTTVIVHVEKLANNSKIYECIWKIVAPIGMRVLFYIKKLSIFEIAQDCNESDSENFSGLAFYSGTSNATGFAQKVLCSSREEDNYTSHTNELFVKFKIPSKLAKPDGKKRIMTGKVLFIPANTGDECGAVVEMGWNETIQLHSPNYPNLYPKSIECIWLIKAPSGYLIRFNLTHYTALSYHPQRPDMKTWRSNFATNVTCQNAQSVLEGSVTFYNGNNTNVEILERFCHNLKQPKIVISTTEQALVTFQGGPYERAYLSGDDERAHNIGFVLYISLVCGGTLYAGNELKTFQLYVVKEDECKFLIKAEDGQRIYFRLDQIRFNRHRASKVRSKSSATVVIYDGIQEDSSTLGMYHLECSPSNSEQISRACANRELRSTGSVLSVYLKGLNTMHLEHIHFSYSTQIESCGGTIHSIAGVIYYPFIENDFECEWFINNTEGNKVELEIFKLKLPFSEYCAESYLEVRESNSSGKIVTRACSFEDVMPTMISRAFWIRLRYSGSEDDSSDIEPLKPELMIKFKKVFGGMTNDGVVSSPIAEDWQSMHFTPVEWTLIGEDDHWLRISIKSIDIPDERDENNLDIEQRDSLKGLVFNEGICTLNGKNDGCGRVEFVHAGYIPPNDFFIKSNLATVLFNAPPGSSFRFVWENIPLTMVNTSLPKANQGINEDFMREFTCGGTLTATFDPQYLTNPGGMSTDGKFTTILPLTSTIEVWRSINMYRLSRWRGGYGNNLKCRWTIIRPMFAGVMLKIISMDLEEHIDCRFDYIAISSDLSGVSYDDGQLVGNVVKFCKHRDVGTKELFSSEEAVTIFFMTDRNRGGRGFVIEYKLVCQSFDYIPISLGVFDQTIQSPNYPNEYNNNLSCSWSIILESSRPILAKFLTMDIEESPSCKKDGITMHSSPIYADGNANDRLCGSLSGWNKTFSNGRLFIGFATDSNTAGKGFQLQLKEQIHDCSSDRLILTEGDLPKVLTSPGFPKTSPNSLDCIWTISAPSGHRIKFTVDPISFNLEDSSMEDVCSGNYLEVRDGPSKLSPLVGRYCGKEPPSTIFSTGSYLNIQYQTDSFVHFSGWNATYEIASCGGSVIIPMNGNRVIISPNYPEPYPSQATCDWTVVAPRGHYVNATFDHLWILFTENCTEDSVALRERGEYILKPVCVFNAVRGKHFTSSQNIMVVSFRSNNTVGRSSRLFCLEKKCGFHLSLVPSKIECGGDVNDDSGYITAPGYPNQLQTHIMCDWTFRAGIGFRYVFDFAFVKHETKYNEVGCYPDIYIANGLNRPVDYYGFVDHIFCSNETQFVSTADLITIRYDDRAAMYEKQNMKERGIPSEKVYAPFRITYLKVPAEFDENACMYHVRRNKTIELRSVNVSRYSVATSPNIDYCHLLIERQFVVGTTVLRFKNFSSSENSFWKPNSRCLDTESYVLVTALGNEPWPFEARFCDGSFKKTANFTVALPHRSFDIHVFQKLHLSSISFNLTVQFLPCGGLIQGPESGILTSPGFYGKENSTYEPDTQCVWSLKAPEGQIVKIKITDMDLEYNVECKHDFLKLFEGGGTDASLVHVYCNNPQDEPIQDRFREVKSRGRYLTLYFFTDMSIERRGFRLEYSFSGFEDECGFTTNRMTGTVISPRNPQDYPNHIYCLWDISVPFGYHVALYFHRFDVQQSDDCSKDYVKISQEHHSRAIAPVGGYYFMFDHEEELKKICGYETPPVFHSESNRIKIEFKSDGKITGKGFNITWKSECGTTFRLNHGVVTSPHYPRFYPNEDMECDYLIEPEYDGTLIITLRILDLELDPYIYDYSRQPCNTDFLELRDVSAKRVIDTFCANSDISSEIAPISVKGPVGVRFVSNTSVFEDLLNRRKHRRGFKISYALSKCGGEINFKEEKELMSVVISSPGFPLPYHHNLDCVWNISAPEKRVISIKHTHLDLEESSDCLFDFVEFFDGSQISNATSMGKFCGAVVPSNQLSTTGRFLVVRFYSDRSANRGGFRIIATASLGPDGGCGGEINVDNSYELIAPLNPKTGQYYNFLRCGWTLKAPTGKILEMRLKDLELEAPDAETGRCYDYIAVYDGYKTISPMLLSNTCKIVEQLPLIMKSSYRVLHIYFESDSDKTFKGFTMEFKTITAPCGGRRTAATEPSELQYESEKMLTRIFPKHQRCRWIIYSKERIPLRVEFSQFSFPSLTPDCTDEYMEIRDAGTPADCHHPACRDTSNGLQIVRLCGSTLPADFISGTSVIQITISAILQSEHTARFRLSYQTLNSCNRVIATQQSMTGHITSPNYPNPYDHNSSCYTTLTALTGYQIFLVFKDFKLEKVRRSFNGQLSTSIREMLTGERNFGPFQNVIDQYSGLYRNEFCEYDYVEIIDSFENRTERYCDYKLPPSFLSSSNTLEIYFKSDSTMAPGGYDAYYYTVRPSDSLSFVYYDFGIISEPQGAITNVGYPGYKNRQRMRWRIDPPNGHKCKLILLTMDFGKNINGECTEGDHLVLGEIGAEGSENTPLNYLPCRDAVTLPKEIPVEPGTSTLLEFYTDDDTADNGDGFRVEWICENYYIMQV